MRHQTRNTFFLSISFLINGNLVQYGYINSGPQVRLCVYRNYLATLFTGKFSLTVCCCIALDFVITSTGFSFSSLRVSSHFFTSYSIINCGKSPNLKQTLVWIISKPIKYNIYPSSQSSAPFLHYGVRHRNFAKHTNIQGGATDRV